MSKVEGRKKGGYRFVEAKASRGVQQRARKGLLDFLSVFLMALSCSQLYAEGHFFLPPYSF